MPREISITCDNCSGVMTKTSSFPHVYGYLLQCVDTKLQMGGEVKTVYIPPLIEKDHFFCGDSCLRQWAIKKTGA